MKKMLILFLLIFTLWGDLPPPEGFHYIDRSTFITNVSEHSKYVFVGYLYRMDEHQYLIEDNTALRLGTSLDTGLLFIIKRAFFDAYGGLEGINFDALARQKEDVMFFPFPFPQNIADDNCNVTKDDYYYEIEEVDDSNITFKLQKRILTDSEGVTQTITY